MKRFAAVIPLLLAQSLYCADCFTAKDPQEQITLCSRAIATANKTGNKTQINAYYRARAGAFVRSKDELYNDAFRDINAAIANDPSDADNFLLMGWARNRAGMYNGALTSFNTAVKLLSQVSKKVSSPVAGKMAWAYYSLAISYELAGSSSVSEKFLKTARYYSEKLYKSYQKERYFFRNRDMERKRRAAGNFSAGAALLEQKKYAQSLSAFQKAMNADPENALYLSWLGAVYFESGDFKRALEFFTRPKENERWHHYIGMCHIALGEYKEAARAFRAAINDKPPQNKGKQLGDVSKKFAEKVDSYLLYYPRAVSAARKEDHKNALEYAHKAVSALKTEAAEKLYKEQKKIFEQKLAERERRPWIIALSVIALAFLTAVFATLFLKRTSTAKARQHAKAKYISLICKENHIKAYEDFIAELNKTRKKPSVINNWTQAVSVSGNPSAVKLFLSHLPVDKQRDYLLKSSLNICERGNFEGALQTLYIIPFPLWKEEEFSAFARILADCGQADMDVSFADGKPVLSPAVPYQAYTSAANALASKNKLTAAELVLSKTQKIDRQSDFWEALVKIKTLSGQIEDIEIESIPEGFRASILEEFMRRGFKDRVKTYIDSVDKRIWKPEYYFYYSACLITEDISKSYEYFKDFAVRNTANKHQKIFYAFGLLFEVAGDFHKAGEIYGKFASLSIEYEDVRERKNFINEGRTGAMMPKAEEILSSILPADFVASMGKQGEK